MSNIRTTVHEALAEAGLSGYERQAEPVIVALERRETDIMVGLRAHATERGMGLHEVDEVFTDVGLLEEEQEAPVNAAPTTSGDEQSILERLDALQNTVNGLIAAARRNGVSV